MSLCLPSVQMSPGRVIFGFESSSVGSYPSSSGSSPFRLKRLSSSAASKPVSDTSKSAASRSDITRASFFSSHSPEILFMAMLSAFSFSGGRSTMTHSASSIPSVFITESLWCPEMTVLPVLSLTTMSSTYPNSVIERFSFSNSASPGFSSFRGL